MIHFLGWLSAVGTLLTGLALLQDTLRTPPKKTAGALYLHYSRAFLWVGVTSLSGLLVFYPDLMSSAPYEVALRIFIACCLLRATPHPWLAYVMTDRFRFHQSPTKKVIT